MGRFLQKKLGHPLCYPNGISVIVSAQDDHQTLRDCVESFLGFGDELIIVTNNATQETSELAEKLASEHSPKVIHIEAKQARDLYENRQAGLEQARYRWVMRCDADYVAYEETDGEKSITELRKWILSRFPVWPTALYFCKVALALGWSTMYEPQSEDKTTLKYIPKVFNPTFEARVYTQNPFLCFKRLGRWEGVPGIRWYWRVKIQKPYWFEVTLRSPRSLLFRKARTDWRESGDFSNYPVLDDYVEKVLLPKEYPGLSVEAAAQKYIDAEVKPYLKFYDENKYFPMPKRIKAKQGQE